MKKCLLLNALLWVLGVSALAQTQGIAFEPVRSWKKVLEKRHFWRKKPVLMQ